MLWAKKIFSALTPKERITFFVALGFIVVSLVFMIGSSVRASTKVVPAQGGVFVEGIVGQPAYINPVLASSNADKSLVRLLFSNLKDLSDKVEMDRNGKTWRVRLKENLFWSDGERLTSDDIIFTVEKIHDTNTSSPLLGSWQGVTVKRVSQLEITFELANPYSFFSENIANLYIIPKHLFEDVPPINWRLSEYNLKPVGSGPFVFDSYSKREDGFITKYSLKENDRFYGNKPFIEKFQINFFTNAEEAVRSFNSGKTDGLGDLDPKNLRGIRRPYESREFGLPSYYAVFINQSEKLPLQDKSVRQALSTAIDRQAIINSALNGKAKPVWGPVPPAFGLDLKEPQSTSSPIDILENAGWKVGPGGIREKSISSNMVPLEITLTVPRLPFLIETANQIRSSWEAVGVKVEIKEVSPNGELDQIIKNRDYEGILLGNALNSGADLFSFWHSSERFHPGLNLSLFNNRDTDSLIEGVRQNFNDNSRKAQLQRLEDNIAKEYPAIFLYSPNYVYATAKSLRGINPGYISEAANRFLEAESWHLKTTRTWK